MKVVQATHHKDDIKYRMSRGIQCSFMSLIPVCWISCEEDLPQELFIENLSINVEYLNNRTRETTVGVYLVSITTFSCFSI